MSNATSNPGLRPSIVSAALRRAGYNPLGSGAPRSREGIRVTGSVLDTVSVAVSLDCDREEAALAADVHRTLVGLGYTVEPNPRAANILTVTRPAP